MRCILSCITFTHALHLFMRGILSFLIHALHSSTRFTYSCATPIHVLLSLMLYILSLLSMYQPRSLEAP